MAVPFPDPTVAAGSRAEVFSRYLEYFRYQLTVRLRGLPADELRRSRVPSGWTPLELLKHLTYVELRWLEWGFEGRAVADPWGDRRADHWYVAPDETLEGLLANLTEQAERSHAAAQGSYVSIETLRSQGELTMTRDNRGPYNYSAEISDSAFRIVATYAGPASSGMPQTLSVDQTMQVSQQ